MKLFLVPVFCGCLLINNSTIYQRSMPLMEKNHPPNVAQSWSDPNYLEIFKYEYPEALRVMKSNVQLFKSTCFMFNIDTATAVSIVFPEFIRYSQYKDIIETLSLDIIYVNLGKEYIDFSIGLMQMKPSFAEKLENYIKTSVKLSKKYKQINNYPNGPDKETRSIRLDRLKTVEWQLVYLCVFCDVIGEIFPKLTFINKEDKIKFYAAAYNSNFLASEEKIRKQINVRYFPYGKGYAIPQYPYSDVAVHFYRNFYSKI